MNCYFKSNTASVSNGGNDIYFYETSNGTYTGPLSSCSESSLPTFYSNSGDLSHYLSVCVICDEFSNYYVKPNSNNLCESFSYVMFSFSFPKYVYLNSGDYIFSSTLNIAYTNFNVSGNTNTNTNGDVIKDKIDTFPNIIFDSSSSITQYIFLYNSKCNLHNVKILHGTNSYSENYIFYSFFFFFL
jgi:hypothetical protein